MIDISLIPKKEAPKSFPINKSLSWISLLILIVSIVAGGVVVLMLTSSKDNLVKLNQKLLELDKNINSQQETAQFAQSVLVANQIIDSHKYPSGLINFLEKNTNTFIQWTSLNVDLSNQTIAISLDGKAHDLLAIAQQIKRLENSKVAHGIKLGGVTSDSVGVSFKLNFSLDNSILLAEY
jgi:flagellar basal body-associated protein FliL